MSPTTKNLYNVELQTYPRTIYSKFCKPGQLANNILRLMRREFSYKSTNTNSVIDVLIYDVRSNTNAFVDVSYFGNQLVRFNLFQII